MVVQEAASIIQELATKQLTKEEAAQFIEAAKILAAEIDEHITERFLEDCDFVKSDEGKFYATTDLGVVLTLEEDEFGNWESNIEIDGVPIAFRKKCHLMDTIFWLNILEDEDE